jgi:hypothetical protein
MKYQQVDLFNKPVLKRKKEEYVPVGWKDASHIPIVPRVKQPVKKDGEVDHWYTGRAYDHHGVVYINSLLHWNIDSGSNLDMWVEDFLRLFWHEFFHIFFRKRIPRKERYEKSYKMRAKVWEHNERIVDNMAIVLAREELTWLNHYLFWLDIFEDVGEKLPCTNQQLHLMYMLDIHKSFENNKKRS